MALLKKCNIDINDNKLKHDTDPLQTERHLFSFSLSANDKGVLWSGVGGVS